MARGVSYKAFNLGILRTIRGTAKRFVALCVICMLGAIMLVGLRAACVDLRFSADEFFDAQGLFDVRVQSTLGLVDDDVAALAAIDGVQAAEGGWTETVYTTVGSGSSKAEVRALSADGINEPLVLEGELPQDATQVAVTRRYADESGLGVGDTLTFRSEADGADGETDAATDDGDDLDFNVDASSSTAIFSRREYTISAIVLDPQDINAGQGSMSFRSSGSAQYAFFVTRDNVLDPSIYTAVYLRVEGSDEPLCYSDEYTQLVDRVTSQVEAVREGREQARGQAIRDEAYQKIADAEAEANQKIADGQREIDDAQATIDDGRAQLEDGKNELTLQEALANKELADAQAQIDDGLSQIEANEAQLDTNEPQVVDGISQIEAGLAQVEAARAGALESAVAQAQAAAREAVEKQFAAQESELAANIETLQTSIAQLEAAAAAGELTPEQQATLTALQENLAQAQAGAQQLAAAKETALASAAEAATQQATERVDQELAAQTSALTAQKADLESKLAQIRSARQTIASTRDSLAQAQQTLDANRASAKEQIAQGWATIAQSEADLASGQAELNDARTTLDSNRAEAAAKIADARAKVAQIEDATWYVQTRTSLSSYSSVESDAGCIEVLGTVLPIIFFVVAVLISLTTMTRMVEEERGLIGLYKALGYSRGRILSKYVVYAGIACLVGCVVGDFLGFVVLPAIIFTIFQTMYALPQFTYHFDAVYALAAVVLFAVGIVGATITTCVKELKECPASLMRPKAPKAGSRIFLERIGFIWRRLSFLNKVTARNLLRYKRRFLMTVFGIAGCVALLVCGFGIRDTVLSLPDRQYGDAGFARYDLLAVTSTDNLDDVALEFDARSQVDDLQRLYVDSVTVTRNGSSESVTLFVLPNDCDMSSYLGLVDETGRPLDVGATGAVITKNAQEVLGFATGDSLHTQDSTMREADVSVTGVCLNYLGNFMIMSQSAYQDAFGKAAENNALLATLEGDDEEQIAFADSLSADTRLLTLTSTAKLVRDFSSAFTLINTVVYVVIVLAAALSFTVVFTLSNTNISERERELATIKVLGFKRAEVHTYINKETIILTLIGILCGLPAGFGLTRGLTYVLKMPSIYFDTVVAWPSYAYAAALALVFTLLVNLMTNRSLDRVDMVGALKSAE